MANGSDHRSEAAASVRINDLYKQESVPAPREIPPLTRIGFKLAIYLLAYLAIVTVFLLADYVWNAPAFPKGLTLNPDELAQFKALSDISLDRTMKLLDALVLKGFLPILTAVLGYIFGTRGADKEAS